MTTSHRSLSRRSFLALAGSMPLAASALARAQFKRVPVGLELYSVRDEYMKDLPGTVTAVAKMGYEIVEFWAAYFSWTVDQAKEVRKLLDGLGITCRSTHNNGPAFAPEGLPKAIELNQIIGSKNIIMSSPPGRMTGADSWKTLGDTLNAVSEKLKPLGMATGYHNHGTEWAPVEGKRPMDILAASTSKDITLQFDVGTCVEAGADPVAWIKANPGRIRSMHCKDWGKGQGRGYAVAFGEGDVAWKEIFAAAESTGGIEYYLIEAESAPPGQQLQLSQKCLDNWKKLRG